jgi:hypothetical protein
MNRVLGQCRCAGVTEAWQEKRFGVMQRSWSDRSLARKEIWGNVEVRKLKMQRKYLSLQSETGQRPVSSIA